MGYYLINHSATELDVIKLAALLAFTAEFPDDGKLEVRLNLSKELVQVSKNGVTRTYSFDELLNG